MLTQIHQKLGTAGFVISIVALVAALGGGAYAASGGLSGKEKKEVEKIAKKFAGKPGSTGTAGPAGPKGDPGAKGDAGASGNNGTNGTNGTSVTTSTFSGEKGTCKDGGIEVKSASPATLVCNGSKGTSGFTAALPKGATETGNWAFGTTKETLVVAPLSFAIPFSTGGAAPIPVYVKAGETGVTECPGTPAQPKAAEGFLCIYEEVANYGTDGAEPAPEANSAGGHIIVSAADPEERFGFGTWAVTGE
jgi:hypothetical protein